MTHLMRKDYGFLPKQNKHHNLNKFDFIDHQFNFKKINVKIKSWAHSSKMVVTSDISLYVVWRVHSGSDR